MFKHQQPCYELTTNREVQALHWLAEQPRWSWSTVSCKRGRENTWYLEKQKDSMLKVVQLSCQGRRNLKVQELICTPANQHTSLESNGLFSLPPPSHQSNTWSDNRWTTVSGWKFGCCTNDPQKGDMFRCAFCMATNLQNAFTWAGKPAEKPEIEDLKRCPDSKGHNDAEKVPK